MLLLVTAPALLRAESDTKSTKPTSVSWGHIEISGSYPEGALPPGLFGEIQEGLSDGLARLERAADDKDLRGVILRINGPSIGWAKLNEFRAAIGRVREKGKKVYAWLDGGSSMDYLLATACDQVVMPESGALMFLGLRAEVSFYKNLFDKLDVKPDMLRVGEFKSAAEPYNRTEMSPEFREEMEAILDDYYRQMVEIVAKSRKLDEEAVRKAMDAGPLTAREAHKLGLLDRIAYQDELEELIKKESDGSELKITRRYGRKKVDTDFSGFAGMMKMMNLLMGVEEPRRRSTRTKIAVIHASGAIMTGESKSDLFGNSTLGSETLIKAIRKAREDDKVKAIVLRVDSPGGSALASDLIWRELELVDKPFIASMGDVAASGGYYISMGADRIFAEPGTLTGSIGVVGGKLALGGLFEKVGITTSVISRGKNSGVMSTTTGFTDSERAAMVKLLHEVYDQFVSKAAAGRKMEKDELEKLARGRVYTGTMAVEKKLVDELGTLDDAVAAAKKAAGIAADEKVELLVLPKAVSPFEALFGSLDADARLKTGILQSLFAGIPAELREPLEGLSTLTQLSREARLVVLPFQLRVR